MLFYILWIKSVMVWFVFFNFDFQLFAQGYLLSYGFQWRVSRDMLSFFLLASSMRLLLVADALVLSAFLTSSGLQWHLRGGGNGEHLSHRLLVYFESSLVMVFLLEALEDSDLHRLAWVVGAGFWSSFFLNHFLWLQKQCMIKMWTLQKGTKRTVVHHTEIMTFGILVPVCRR